MNTCKKILALVLSLCLLSSVFVFSASAEEARGAVELTIGTVTATKFKEGDPETVLQLAIRASSNSKEVAFDSFDANAELSIYSGVYSALHYSEEEIEEWLIAKAKPVSYENGVLTVDVYAKDGTAGAKLVALLLNEKVLFGDDYDKSTPSFVIRFPEGLLKGSATGSVFSGSKLEGVEIEGAAAKEIKYPSWYVALFDTNGNKIVSFLKTALALALLPVLIVIMVKDALPTINYVLDLYGFRNNKVPLSNLIQIF